MAVAATNKSPSTTEIYFHSYNDISANAIFFDGIKMAVGYFIMFAYVSLLLGRINFVEHR